MAEVITINNDKKCSACGEEGATQNGICLKCNADKIKTGNIKTGNMPEEKVEFNLQQVFNIKYATQEADEGLVTKISFEVNNLHPAIEAQIKYMQSQHAKINVIFNCSRTERQLRFDVIETGSGEIVEDKK